MLGAIAGDIVGSIYEHANIKTKDFPLFGPGCRFTDDTVLSVAVADCLLNQGDFAQTLRAYTRAHPRRGYGAMFRRWALSDDLPAYGSWGNGSAMRVGPVGFAARHEDEALALAARSSAVSHDHPDAVAGAQAVALAIYLARQGRDRAAIRAGIAARFGYDLTESVAQIRARYTFDVSAAGTVPPALICALEAEDFEDALRNAVSIGGDTDTVACIAGGLAEALFGLPEEIAAPARAYLTDDLEAVVARFHETYGGPART
ncbi:MAG: ADP-ribosylglycohydrolase family protein [Proteobacteria bacterium]|nr:ADP-ribosylglycohydrolase family protein [Pseudomonadota bacterium]